MFRFSSTSTNNIPDFEVPSNMLALQGGLGNGLMENSGFIQNENSDVFRSAGLKQSRNSFSKPIFPTTTTMRNESIQDGTFEMEKFTQSPPGSFVYRPLSSSVSSPSFPVCFSTLSKPLPPPPTTTSFSTPSPTIPPFFLERANQIQFSCSSSSSC
eukprot:c8190_g1_i1.p1 GENE.c8190_g1_i1~~c8190_g1_i1.p1  ORF type:complete len:156 (-),score=63.02 c8190_g1_i1:138-605(-)